MMSAVRDPGRMKNLYFSILTLQISRHKCTNQAQFDRHRAGNRIRDVCAHKLPHALMHLSLKSIAYCKNDARCTHRIELCHNSHGLKGAHLRLFAEEVALLLLIASRDAQQNKIAVLGDSEGVDVVLRVL